MDFLVAALQLTPTLAAAGADLAAFVEWSVACVDRDGGPTDSDWDQLLTREAELPRLPAPPAA